ncbi:MAG TPA: DUF1549 and DUF1553 domain-containing protein [Gemmataceae bacterium]|nr:DUF1549 and DUF1553 domain-containing protein [Gemmataceae bacterium]
MRQIISTVAILLGLAIPFAARGEEPVNFRQEVMAVLSRGGCNQGACHGNLHGKGGFKLSLRGEAPDLDLAAVTMGQMGRRINLQQPEASLILQKATARVPHEGGQRFPANSPEFAILKRWLEAGARADPPKHRLTRLVIEPTEIFLLEPARDIQVRAWGILADGSKKDVSGLAVFESSNLNMEVDRKGLVRSSLPGETTVTVRYLHLQQAAHLAFVPARPGFQWSNPPTRNYIDELIDARLRKLRMNPSELCTEGEFVRRAYLDLLGLLPTPEETRHFLADTHPDKRAALVDTLLGRPEFAEYWALRWSDVLRNEEKQLDRKGTQVYYDWIRQAIAKDMPLNEFARELIASQGSTYKVPAANYYRALRDPQTRTEATAQVFLGIRMLCAKCHNHPFNQWTQSDYYQLAAFFARVQYKIKTNNRKDKLDSHEFIGDQEVYQDDSSEMKHPVTGAVLQPRFLGGPTLELGPDDDRSEALANWVADPNNPFFARTQANRIWSYLLGRGIVEPNDDFRQSNPPVNEPLLEALATDLVKNRFDQKHLIRTIMNSRTYQTSARPNDTNADDEINFSHTYVRSLPAEALLDALAQVTGTKVAFGEHPDINRAGQMPSMPVTRRKQSAQGGYRFLRLFGKPERLLSCDCERSDSTTVAQALNLITGDIVNKALDQPDNRLGRLLKEGSSNAAILDELYLACLCRAPTLAERSTILPTMDSAVNRREAWEDVLWGLVNSKEFQLRR